MGCGNSKHWVLLAAGSKGWENYRHQANVCHAYQVAHRNGIPDEQIVVMMYDDIATNKENPFPGNIINIPNGPNVYPGVLKDYTGADVSAKNFLAVLRGDSSAVKKKGPKKVIQSGKNDSIFIYLTDHGGLGVFQFPHSTLYAHDLIDTVNMMSKNGKFSKMVIYLEACHSGSMLTKLSNNGNVYAVAACKPEENCYACFHDKERNAYLSDVFTYYWLHHTETVKFNVTSLGDQFSYLQRNISEAMRKKRTSQTPCYYGDEAMLKLMLSEFLGQSPHSVREANVSQPLNIQELDAVDSAEVPLIIQANRIKNEQDQRRKEALKRQYNELIRKRKTLDEALQKIAERTRTSRVLIEKREVTRTYKFKVVAEHFRTTLFNWEDDPFVVTPLHLQVLVNLCEIGLDVESIKTAINDVSHGWAHDQGWARHFQKMSQSKPSQRTGVRIGHSLNEGERAHVSRRRETVLQCLKRHGIICPPGRMPHIALLGSGGGERAMLGLLGSLVQLKNCDLLDSIMYLSGVSGSTWCMASLYKESDWSTKLADVTENIIKRLDGPAVSRSDAWTKLSKYYGQKDNFSLTDVWAVTFVRKIMKEMDESTISGQRENHSEDPYPIYTVIDKQCKKKKLSRDVWFEVGPHEAGYSLTGAFVDSAEFGSQFEEGRLVKPQPEIDMLYLQGLCGSALADRQEILRWLWEQIKKLLPFEQYSPQGQKMLLTLAELNICVLSKEDPTSLIREMTVLLEGKLDKRGRAMFISKEELLHDPKHQKLNEYTLMICDNFQDWFEDSESKAWTLLVILKIMMLLATWTWGTTYNFLHHMKVEDVHPSVLSEKERKYMDAGLLNNSPYFPMLRKERCIDLFISFDFSSGDPMETVVKAAEMCRELKIPFPVVKPPPKTSEPGDFYRFEGTNGAPTVIHIPLFNKVNCDGHIKEWEEKYKTFQGPYSHDMIINLIEKAGENVINNKENIVRAIRSVIEKKGKTQ